jgi:hypothetical protein
MAILMDSMYQMAAYCIGATILLEKEVHPGGIIMPRHYIGKNPSLAPPGVFWEAAWKFHHTAHILDGVRSVIASIRSGRVWMSPNLTPMGHCNWCWFKTPDRCIPKLEELVDPKSIKVRDYSDVYSG